MGDRNNPIKFGPEWLRNLARESGGSSSNNQNTPSTSGNTGAAAGASGGAMTLPASASNMANTASSSLKVKLAKLRYGKEEMLALYDRTAEAPAELKSNDTLYQPRGKPPVALNNSFEEDMRDTMRTGNPGIRQQVPPERVGFGRGRPAEITPRQRLNIVRQLYVSGNKNYRMQPGYSSGADDDTATSLRSWGNNGNGANNAVRNPTSDQAEWNPNKMYRSKRPTSSTNWRQTSRDDDEWRASEGNRPRPGPQEKWERDWGDRPNQDKQPSWNTNRRTWVGGDSQSNEENLPEWAVDNPPSDSCGGTFDSSGAFHGYSNDDTNLPKNQEIPYALTRSHTHGSFVRSKTAEEGSDEWWASEKAKKLSPKRFDASDIQFKKPSSISSELGALSNSSNAEESAVMKVHENAESSAGSGAVDNTDSNTAANMEDNFKKSVKFTESKKFDALMRSDINLEEASDERGNFQSVMITPNNSLRQKHQNIVSSAGNISTRKPGILQLIQNSQNCQNAENENSKQQSIDEKMVEDMMDLTMEDNEITKQNEALMANQCMSSAMSTVVNSVSHMTSPILQIRMPNPGHPNQGMTMAPNANMGSTPGIQGAGLPTPSIPVGITNSALNASLGLSLGPKNNVMNQKMGIPIPGVPPPVLPNQGMPNPNVGSTGLQTGQGMPGFQSGMAGMANTNVNNSLFLQPPPNTNMIQPPSDLPMNHGNQNMFPMHGLQHSGSQTAFNSSIYSNLIQQSPPLNMPNLNEQWYYEDPKKTIQGPFSSKEMYNWYRAGFFTSSLMVRRACDVTMRPLGSYGPVVPFLQVDVLSSYPMGNVFEPRNQAPHDSLLNSQQGLGMDDSLQFGTVGMLRNSPFGQQQMVDSLWSQPPPSPDVMWMQQTMNTRNDTRVNNLPMYFWDQQDPTPHYWCCKGNFYLTHGDGGFVKGV